MENRATLVLELETAERTRAIEPDCNVEVVRLDGTVIHRSNGLQFPPSHAFGLPAFPQGQNLHCVITPSLYRTVQSEFFTLDDDERREESSAILRHPDRWQPVFTTWNNLPAAFDPLKAVLEGVNLKHKHRPDIGIITPDVYDAMQGREALLAKMALLNLFAVLRTEIDPVSEKRWFDLVKRIETIDRERFVAKVDGDLFESVSHIANNLGKFKKQGFFRGDTALHHDNIPSEFQITGQMFTAKCAYEQGNTQFSVVNALDKNGERCVLLDCDMDEHSNIIEHSSDVFKHIFSEGTHPVDIHEYIVHHSKGIDLGYDLKPA